MGKLLALLLCFVQVQIDREPSHGLGNLFNGSERSSAPIPDPDDGSAKAGRSNKNSGPQHTLGPLRHLPLGIQILFGSLGIAASGVGIIYALKRTVEIGGSAEAFAIYYIGCIALSVVSLMLVIGALVAL